MAGLTNGCYNCKRYAKVVMPGFKEREYCRSGLFSTFAVEARGDYAKPKWCHEFQPQQQTTRKETSKMKYPSFSLYHPNAKGTGSAIRMTFYPAGRIGEETLDGHVDLRIAPQKTVATVGSFATFAWECAITVELGFSDITKILQVFCGECESLEDGKGIYHRVNEHMQQKISLRHILEPVAGYELDITEVSGANGGRIENFLSFFIMPWEALGLLRGLEGIFPPLMFGIQTATAAR